MYVLHKNCDGLERKISSEFFSWKKDENCWSWIKYLAELKIKVETDGMGVMDSGEQSSYFCMCMW